MCKVAKTIIYYYSATGNSLYTARKLQEALDGAEIKSMVEAMQDAECVAEAQCVGFVFPMHYFGLPMQVEEFIERLTIKESPYLFAVATCGVPYWGRPFKALNEILEKKRRRLHGEWFLRLVSNYLPLRDTAADWRIAIRAWLAERKLRKIAQAVEAREGHETWQLLEKMSIRYHKEWKARQKEIDTGFTCDGNKCTSCGLCERICPKGNIIRPTGKPEWQHDCVECLGCLHICPAEAIDYGPETKGRKRYRHKEISAVDLVKIGRKVK